MRNNNEYFINSENSIIEDVATKNMVTDYHGEFKKYRPVFKPRAANYYPNTCGDRICHVLILLPCYIMCAITLYLFTWWGLQDTRQFGYICVIVWLVYLLIIGSLFLKTKIVFLLFLFLIFFFVFVMRVIRAFAFFLFLWVWVFLIGSYCRVLWFAESFEKCAGVYSEKD